MQNANANGCCKMAKCKKVNAKGNMQNAHTHQGRDLRRPPSHLAKRNGPWRPYDVSDLWHFPVGLHRDVRDLRAKRKVLASSLMRECIDCGRHKKSGHIFKCVFIVRECVEECIVSLWVFWGTSIRVSGLTGRGKKPPCKLLSGTRWPEGWPGQFGVRGNGS